MSTIKRIKDFWKSSFFYRAVSNRIDRHFRRQLKNEQFSILCSTCIGGCIYHRLGKPFLSPTINLYILQRDFIPFVLYLRDYLRMDLRFCKTEKAYPVAELGGDGFPTIRIHFNHAKTEEEAREQWEKRKKRIDYNHLYVILYNLDGVTEEQLHCLDDYPCKNKVVLTGTPLPGISWSQYIPVPRHGKDRTNYLSQNMFGLRYYERKWNFVEFLNHD